MARPLASPLSVVFRSSPDWCVVRVASGFRVWFVEPVVDPFVGGVVGRVWRDSGAGPFNSAASAVAWASSL